MSYKIAVASSDGKMIDRTFGEAERFLIYEVENGVCREARERVCRGDDKRKDSGGLETDQKADRNCGEGTDCGENDIGVRPVGNGKNGAETGSDCVQGSQICGENDHEDAGSTGVCSEMNSAGVVQTDSCGTGGACGLQSGCSGRAGTSGKVELISDCRCVVCRKIGFHIQKQLERRAISAFDVSCSVEEALEKISFYFERVDNHESLKVRK